MFGKKTAKDREADGKEKLDAIAQGKGLTGKLAQGFMGAEATAQVQQANEAVKNADAMQAMAGAGMPTVEATVVSVADTGQLINFDPMVDITLDLNGSTIAIQTLVSKLQIPRPGDTALLMPMAGQPSGYVWAGLKPG
jgi:hypothetical protein